MSAQDAWAQRNAPAQPAGRPAAATMLRALGAVIRAARRVRGLSQEDFADRAQFDRTYPSLIERGLRDPKLSTLLRICVALDCTLLELLSAASPAESSPADRTGCAGAHPPAHRSPADGTFRELPAAGVPCAAPGCPTCGRPTVAVIDKTISGTHARWDREQSL